MSTQDRDDSRVFLGGRARNFAAWMTLVGTFVCFVTAFAVSWPLGPGYVDEGGVTALRIALATLVFGLGLVLGLLGFFLMDILVRVKRLSDEVKQAREGKP
jgi:hypothetical protein